MILMAKKRIKKENKVMVGVTCQCQDSAVTKPPTLLRKTQCKVCGKIFKTNRDPNKNGQDICFNCKKSR